MEFSLGFGQTETDTALRIIQECSNNMFVSDDKEAAVKAIEKQYDDDSKQYGAMSKYDAPERYTYFFSLFHEIYPGKYFVEFTMHHINRHYPFSPDGWALLVTKWILSVDKDEDDVVYQGV